MQETKVALSTAPATRLRFIDDPIHIDAPVTRTDFEAWIAEDVTRMRSAGDRLLETTGVRPAEVDHVFLTGGTSCVPAVRQIFETRFGAERTVGGEEFTSVATGLARRALRGV